MVICIDSYHWSSFPEWPLLKKRGENQARRYCVGLFSEFLSTVSVSAVYTGLPTSLYLITLLWYIALPLPFSRRLILSLFLSLPLSTSSLFSARVSSVLLYAPLSSLLFLSTVVPIFFSYITDFVVVGGGFVFATHHRRRAVFYSILLLLQPSPPFRRLFAAASSPRSPFFHSPPLEPIGSSVG